MPGDTGIDKQLSQPEQTFINGRCADQSPGDCETFCSTRRWRFFDAGEGVAPAESHSAEGGGESLCELGFLFGEDGAEIERQAVVFDAGDYADARRGAAEALLELRGGVAGAGDANNCGWQGLGGSRAATRKGRAVSDFEFDFI